MTSLLYWHPYLLQSGSSERLIAFVYISCFSGKFCSVTINYNPQNLQLLIIGLMRYGILAKTENCHI